MPRTIYHVTVEQMRLIEWARTHNWAVWFPDFSKTPSDFTTWFPATDINYSIMQLEKQDFSMGVGAFDIPKSKGIYQVTMSIFDGARARVGSATNVLQLHKWIETWANEIVDLEKGVQTLSEACRQLEIIHYDSMSYKIGHVSYAVFPHGEISFVGSSEVDINKIDLTFSIAGTTNSDSITKITL